MTSPPYTSRHDQRSSVMDEASQLTDTLEAAIAIAPEFPAELFSSWAAAWDGVIADPADACARERMLFYARARGSVGRQDLLARQDLWRQVQSPRWYATATPTMVLRAVRETSAFASTNLHAAAGLIALRTRLPACPGLCGLVLQRSPRSVAAREIRLLHGPDTAEAAGIAQLVSTAFPPGRACAVGCPHGSSKARTPTTVPALGLLTSPDRPSPEVA